MENGTKLVEICGKFDRKSIRNTENINIHNSILIIALMPVTSLQNVAGSPICLHWSEHTLLSIRLDTAFSYFIERESGCTNLKFFFEIGSLKVENPPKNQFWGPKRRPEFSHHTFSKIGSKFSRNWRKMFWELD